MSVYTDMTAWTDLVSAVYKEKHSANPDYKFKDAMKDAKKQYKAPTALIVPKNKSNKRKKSNKNTRSRKGPQKRDSRKKK